MQMQMQMSLSPLVAGRRGDAPLTGDRKRLADKLDRMREPEARAALKNRIGAPVLALGNEEGYLLSWWWRWWWWWLLVAGWVFLRV